MIHGTIDDLVLFMDNVVSYRRYISTTFHFPKVV